MANNKSRTVISFDPGCSGHWLAVLISDSKVTEFFRIDVIDNILKYTIIPYFQKLAPVTHPVIVTHETDINRIRSEFCADRVIRIRPNTYKFNALYNVFVKKYLLEEDDITQHWPNNAAYCYNQVFEGLKDWYNILSRPVIMPGCVDFDFGNMFDLDKLTKFLTEMDVEVTDDMINMHQQYLENQETLKLDVYPQESMQSIVSRIPADRFAKNPWFACYCIFCFEQSNNLTEQQRLWSIDTLPIVGARELINMSTQYN
jgi:hypothetical protein